MIPLIENSKDYGNNTAIIDEHGTYTYHQLYRQACCVATHIIHLTGSGNEPVLFLMPSGFGYVAVQWGIWLAGKIAVPVHTAHPAEEIKYLVEDTGAPLFIYESSFKDKVIQATGGTGILLDFAAAGEQKEEVALPSIEPEQDALMIYTSGTTGKPKGVVITHHQLDTQIRSLSQAWNWSNKDRTLNVLPMHHVHGVVNITCCALYNGAVLELRTGFDAGYVRENMCSGKLTLFMAVPTIYHKLIQYYTLLPHEEKMEWKLAMSKMRLMVSGSAALPVTVLEQWREISTHTLLERYGMTEIGMALSNPLRGERKPGYVGKPLPFVAVMIADESGAAIKEAGVPGELYVSGATVFKRYWRKSEETARSFDQGWFKTGDIVECDTEGNYKILGRNSSDIIKSGGYKISALEIENVLSEHTAVEECAVIAIADPEWGETIAAVIVGSLGTEELKAWLKEKLAPYKMPRKWIMTTSLPRNAMGKVLKKELKSLFP